MRTSSGRRYSEVYYDLVDHCGGAPSAPQELLIRRISALNLWCDQQEQLLAQGKDFEVSLYSTASNSLLRLCEKLGIPPLTRDITPDLDQYLKAVSND